MRGPRSIFETGQACVRLHAPFRARWTVAFGLWAVSVWVVSSLPAGTIEETGWQIPLPPGSDKVAHFLLYAIGGFCLLPALWAGATGKQRLCSVAAAVLLIGLFGALDEWHQLSTPGRSGGDVGDWIADVLGGLIGVLCFRWLLRMEPEPPSSETAERGPDRAGAGQA
jgi:VanZ family protein